LIEATVARFGQIDILVNNAALTDRSDLMTTDAAIFDRIMAVNARAPLLLVQAALPHFRKAGRGVVLNIGSVNGYGGEECLLAYSMSKGALMTLSRNLSSSLALEHIRVNHFNVGWVLTPNEYALKIRDGLPADWPEKLPKEFAPSGRLMAPEEIARFAVAFVEDGPISGSVVELEQHPVIGYNPPKSVD
jgi:NAD(P)-dependent dehydrogenase (short-subunit alcohol dehydrogenase family)